MTRCPEFYDKFEKDGNFCGLSPGAISQIKAYNEMRSQIAKHIPDKSLIVNNFPENACRGLTSIAKDDETRTWALDHIVKSLKKGETITRPVIIKIVKDHLKESNGFCEIKPKMDEELYVRKGSNGIADGKEVQAVSPFQPAPGSIPETDALPQPSLAEQIGIPKLPPQHSVDADENEKLKRDRKLMEVWGVTDTPKSVSGFQTAAELINGGIVTRPAPYKITPEPMTEKEADDYILQVINRWFAPKSKELWETILTSGELSDSPARLFEALVCRIGGE